MNNLNCITIHRYKCGRWVNETYSISDFRKEDSLVVIESYHDEYEHGTTSIYIDKDGVEYRVKIWLDLVAELLDVDIIREGVILENLETTMQLEPSVYRGKIIDSPTICLSKAYVDDYVEVGVDDYFTDVEVECISVIVRFLDEVLFVWDN